MTFDLDIWLDGHLGTS